MPRKPAKAGKKRRVRSPPPADHLAAVSRAQVGVDEEKRPRRAPPEDRSIEDPLEDWPADND